MKNSTFESESSTKRLGVKRVDDRYFPRSIATRNCFRWLKKRYKSSPPQGKNSSFYIRAREGVKVS